MKGIRADVADSSMLLTGVHPSNTTLWLATMPLSIADREQKHQPRGAAVVCSNLGASVTTPEGHIRSTAFH